MGLTNCKMKIALIYSSITGNTRELVNIIEKMFMTYSIQVTVYPIEQFVIKHLHEFDGVVIGTYTWGNGEIPQEMLALYHAFEKQEVKHVVTGVVGTGDSFYSKFCGAVDEFRDMLYVHTNLAVTLKVELLPQLQDLKRCKAFVERFGDRLKSEMLI